MKVEIITEFEENSPLEAVNEEAFMDHLSPIAIQCILQAINEAGYNAHIFGGIPKLVTTYSDNLTIDKKAIYLNISNGMTQPSRRMQAPLLCEMLGLRYSGSTPFAVALMNNKYFSKRAVSDLVYTPTGILLNKASNVEYKIEQMQKYPAILKPNGEGGSYGIYQENVVYNMSQAIKKAYELLENYDEILVEELIPGTEITNLVIGNNNNFLLNEIVVYKTYGKFEHSNLVRDIRIKCQNISEIYSIDEYTDDDNLINMIKSTSIAIFERIGCRDIARIDYKIKPDGELVFLEINSNPNLYAKYVDVICNKKQLTYSQLLSLILMSAASRYGGL